MKLGLGLGYWGAGKPEGVEEAVTAAEECGFDSVWTSEAYGSDALTPLAWLGARTTRLTLGTAVMQMSARTPAATAMAAMTMDHLSGGRFALGIGASGPQVVEGWYGQPYRQPLARTREYVEILRAAMRRDVVQHTGRHYQVPIEGGTGLGKPLKSTLHPVRETIPILIAAEGPKNVALTAEIADGWLPLFYSPYEDSFYRRCLDEGFAARGERPADFEVALPVQVVVDEDVERAADRLRPHIALYVGGMGAKGANFHYEAVARLGFEAECERIQELYLAGRKEEAVAAVSTEMVSRVALVGPVAKIKDELAAWEESLVTTMVVHGSARTVQQIAEIVL
ncbi:LLM class F420-dependent oxidoreductase [Arsenicicoccus sp. MKL-02]|uniref:LLM class F420-dependent oxidoreductase n=1 Tax=Arsenicicoccus cauae TaxID=2663847 RepID=A0A6I3ILZ1_9MICO|nr:LLM class F420-dependent oxidoreductase [Arsenicicoccus cauae]MTB70970.1 LLM class F420-dependent oxidoreductase [Arsenicicoccus cauae]